MPSMKKYLLITTFLLVCALCVHAETLVLRTGTRVQGEIVFQNEEVIILRDATGARFQYMRADIEEVLTGDAVVVEEEQVEETAMPEKKAAILLELGGGGAFVPNEVVGGAFSVDFLVGSHHIGERHLFVGGGLGYHGLFLGGEKYNFLPIQVALRMPLMEQKHAPFFGVALGYGIALSKTYLGGIYADLDFGYRYQINPKSALSLGLFAQFQQPNIPVTEIIDGAEYSHTVGRNLITSGLKFAFYF